LSEEAHSSKRRLYGYLRLNADKVGDRTSLTRKEFKAPIHISKPYWDDHSLLVNLMSPTAGLLEGDEVEVDVTVGNNASLVLSSPTALRIHKMDNGGNAIWNQRFSVGEGALMEYNPEWLMLQEDSSLAQSTEITLSEGADLFFIESYASGRIAHGESFKFRRFTNRFELRSGSQLSSRERFSILPASDRPQPWPVSEMPFFASIVVSSLNLDDDSPLWNEAYGMNESKLLIGSSRLAKGPCWNIRILSDDPVKTRTAIDSLRTIFYREIGRSPTKLRR